MSKVNIRNLSVDQIVSEYVKLDASIKKFEAQKEIIRERLLELHAEGTDFDPLGLKVTETVRLDMQKCTDEYIKKTGVKPPMIVVPEVVIPAHEELDEPVFKILLERNGINIGKSSYRILIDKDRK